MKIPARILVVGLLGLTAGCMHPGPMDPARTGPFFVPDNHAGDVATATFDREMASSLEENSNHVLTEIDAALARIDAGTYGVCERCGKPIDEERLEALPWATLCIDDKRKQERG